MLKVMTESEESIQN